LLVFISISFKLFMYIWREDALALD